MAGGTRLLSEDDGASRSRLVHTNQSGPHPGLARVLQRHAMDGFRRPIAGHTRAAFEAVAARLKGKDRPLILDSGCGSGESSAALAEEFPRHMVVALDKSAVRLERALRLRPQRANVLFVRADYFDFWRLARRAGWKVQRHFLLYPNPWPKKAHLMRRVYGHPAFFDLLALGGTIEVRSNWRIYLEEFALALAWCLPGLGAKITAIEPRPPRTAFERKYGNSHHCIFRLEADLSQIHQAFGGG